MDIKKIKIICLILARSGSKGVSNKNIKLLAGKPLIGYVLEQAKKCDFFDEIVVSSDSLEILQVADNYGADTLINRPPELATDTAKSIDAVKHSLSLVDADYVVLLNACTPLTQATDMANCVKMALETKCDSVVSLVEDFSAHPSKTCKLDGDKIIKMGSFKTGERQEQEKIYRRNTAIYLAKKEVIMSGVFFGEDCRGYVMDKSRSWDINDMWDLDIAEYLIKKQV